MNEPLLNFNVAIKRGSFELTINSAFRGNRVHAIFGPSGSGKTSLVRAIAGLDQHSNTDIRFNGDIWQSDTVFIPTDQRNIAFIFQDARLFPFLTVRENIEYAIKRQRQSNGVSCDEVLDQFGLQALAHQQADTLSAGQAQRTAIARAIASNPQLLIMDEPLASLDEKNKAAILSVLKTLPSQLDIPIIYISHQLEELSQIASNMLLLDDHGVVAQGPMIDLCSRLDLDISHQENAASIINVMAKEHESEYGLTRFTIDNASELVIADQDCPIGSTRRVRVPARDISIALTAPNDSSILNILPAVIDDIESSDAQQLLIRLAIGDQALIARLTRKSVERLGLHKGLKVYAQIKSVALLADHSRKESETE